ncbi:MAG TPA: imidazolonepropionase [Vicinamibacterales bacterium]|nr:imidazolonepropionase [Vicinamibacterales bacterium]HPW20227.1 imidazolonepropionase [Vicinamibacterales bacterium]
MPRRSIIRGARVVFTCAGGAPKSGPAQADARPISGASVVATDGVIDYVGHAGDADLLAARPGDTVIDAAGGTVVPGLVDPHTHAVFGGDRREELRRRLGGATYAEIAAGGGGILSTVRATREASEEALVASAKARLDQMLACGTTTCEIKSGYGLQPDAELKILRAIRRLKDEHPIDVVATFMGAHEIPAEHRANRRRYIDQVVGEMIPAAARAGLAEWCDVFCESGVYTPEEAAEILEAGARHGLKPRIHADELAESGGALVAARVGARSADHLLHVTPRGIHAMKEADVVATLLPIAAFYLKLGRFAPARDLIEGGVPVALASDLNPGGGFSPSMPFAMTLACFAMRMTVEEALVAATINAAYAIDRHDRAGSLEAGKDLDAVVVDGDAVDLLKVGAPAIRAVVKRGQVVWRRPVT